MVRSRPQTRKLAAAEPATAQQGVSPLAYKERLYTQFARIGKAVASPPRLELLELLCQAPRSVEALAAEAGLTIANTSRHLQILRAAGLVEATAQGLHHIYRLSDSTVAVFCQSLQDLARKRLADIDRLVESFGAGHDAPEPIALEELRARQKAGSVTLIDVRPAEEFAAGHLPGAVSVPLRELQARAAALPKSKTIVAYCRGGFCIMALQAVQLLRAHGFRAFRIEAGVPEWRANGGTVETGSAD
ncbi:MAG: ArsR/SmtB family transcription factor [Planctomycetota bacterium]